MVAEYVKRMYHKDTLTDIWFWRDSSGNEVDFLVEEGTSLKVFEFKSGETIMPDMFRSLTRFDVISGNAVFAKTLVYGGSENQERSVGNVLSWKDFGW